MARRGGGGPGATSTPLCTKVPVHEVGKLIINGSAGRPSDHVMYCAKVRASIGTGALAGLDGQTVVEAAK